jgi:hypothetical protein
MAGVKNISKESFYLFSGKNLLSSHTPPHSFLIHSPFIPLFPVPISRHPFPFIPPLYFSLSLQPIPHFRVCPPEPQITNPISSKASVSFAPLWGKKSTHSRRAARATRALPVLNPNLNSYFHHKPLSSQTSALTLFPFP